MMIQKLNLSSLIVLAIILIVISISFAVSIGSVSIEIRTVWGVLINKFFPEFISPTWSKGREAIIWDIRFLVPFLL